MRNWKKDAKLEEVSFKRLPVSAENQGVELRHGIPVYRSSKGLLPIT
jgi:hypothetical protein